MSLREEVKNTRNRMTSWGGVRTGLGKHPKDSADVREGQIQVVFNLAVERVDYERQ